MSTFRALLLTLLPGASLAAQAVDYHAVRGCEPKLLGPERIEGEHLPLLGTSRIQGMRGFGPQWSDDAHVLWSGVVGDTMRTTFGIERSGRWHIRVRLTLAPDYGLFTARLDGEVLREGIDLYSPRVELAELLDFGELELSNGVHTLTFEMTGANPKSRKFDGKGYLLGFDYLDLECLEPPLARAAPSTPSAQPALSTPSAPSGAVSPATAVSLDTIRPLLERHCVRCHGQDDEIEGDVDLAKLETRADFLASAELARLAADVVDAVEMPPEDEPQPSAAERALLTDFFNGVVRDYTASTARLEPVVMRRMNRYEYNNAVRDLLQLKGDIYALPEKVIRGDGHFDPASGRMPRAIRVSNRTLGKNQIERQILSNVDPFAIDLQAEHGFNNRGEELGTSTILMESLLKLGRSIVRAPEFDSYSKLQLLEASDRPLAERLRPFLDRAFRRPVSDATLRRYVTFHSRELERTGSYRDAIKSTISAVLASPKFVFMVENRASGRTKLDEFELAQRLAMFLWSSIPDEELLQLAKQDRLHRELDQQVTRMLEDRRSRALAENFARQWMRLDQLVTAVPDYDRFETYYSRIGCEQWKFGLQTMIEPLLLFESIMVEDRSIMLLVDSRYAYRSDELQGWYERPNDPFSGKGNHGRFSTGSQVYRRRSLDSRREGGIVTTAAVLTMTSTPLRTSPIKRGAWVATVMLNDPPPPPPDVVPEIETDDTALAEAGITIRERLKQHATNQSCASCHARIDPLGFALESYDPVGRWRDTYRGGLPVDASGKLFGTMPFETIEQFKDALLERPEMFMRGFSEHLLSYALGRELHVSDEAAVDKITRQVRADHGQFSTVVSAIVRSAPFRHKAAKPTEQGANKGNER